MLLMPCQDVTGQVLVIQPIGRFHCISSKVKLVYRVASTLLRDAQMSRKRFLAIFLWYSQHQFKNLFRGATERYFDGITVAVGKVKIQKRGATTSGDGMRGAQAVPRSY